MKNIKEQEKEIKSAIRGIDAKDIIFAVTSNKDEDYEGFSFIETQDDMLAVGEFIARCMLESGTLATTVMLSLKNLSGANDEDAENASVDFHEINALPIFINKNFKS